MGGELSQGGAPKRPRILFVASIGGTLAGFVAPLSERLRADGFETVAAAGNLGSLSGFDRAYELPTFRRRGPAEVLDALRTLTRVIRRERPALLHLHTPPALVIGRLAGRRLGVPSVAVVLGTFLEPWGRNAIIYASVEAALARLSARTIALNTEDAAFYRRWARPGTVEIAPVGAAGLDRGRINSGRSHPRRVADPPSILVVGRLTTDKNLDVAVEAFRRLQAEHPTATLTFLGSTVQGEPEWKVPPLPGVRHLPYTPDPYPIMAGADLILSSSPREGLPNNVLEGLTLGIPVAAVTNRGVREIQKQCPSLLVVSRNDPADLASAMRRALGRQPSESERERLLSTWSREAALDFNCRLIRQILPPAAVRP